MSTLLFLPLLALGFVVLVGTITAVTWLHLRRGPHVSVDNARIETQSWLRIPCLDALFEFPQRLPGMYRPAGTWIDSIILLASGGCFVWESPGVGLLLAILSSLHGAGHGARAVGTQHGRSRLQQSPPSRSVS